MASDKGLQAELNELSQHCFCETTLASDMRKLMDGVHFLTRARMTQEALAEARSKHDAMWKEIAAAHEKHLEGFSGRLRNIEPDARREMADIAWKHTRKACPKQTKKKVDVSYLLEAWNRAGKPQPEDEMTTQGGDITTEHGPLKDKVGQHLELTGKAENAKGGAVLVVDESAVIYLEGLDSWPDELHGKEVTVEGTLAYKKMIPDPSPGPEHSAGAYGKQYVLEDPKWEE